jgi:hypothetical protein
MRERLLYEVQRANGRGRSVKGLCCHEAGASDQYVGMAAQPYPINQLPSSLGSWFESLSSRLHELLRTTCGELVPYRYGKGEQAHDEQHPVHVLIS